MTPDVREGWVSAYLWDGLVVHESALDGWDVEVFCYFYGLGDLSGARGGIILDFDQAGSAGGEEEGVEEGGYEAGGWSGGCCYFEGKGKERVVKGEGRCM